MKISHKSKKTVPPHPQVAEIITRLLNTPDNELPDVLGQIDSWKWPRSDLNAWIKVLNKLDAILEEVIREYDVDKIQLNPFPSSTKQTICEILRFERLLLENSTNRKMFNSYDRLNGLLSTSDLDVLFLALNLLLRPSQQYSAQPSVTHALNISTPRLLSLAKRWPNLRESGISLADLASSKGNEEVRSLPSEVREVDWGFYRTDTSQAKAQEIRIDTDGPDSPRKASASNQPSLRASSSGVVHVHIDQETLKRKELMVILAETVEAYSVPEDEKFELMCRIRSSAILGEGQSAEREKLVVARLLAVAIFGHTHSESQAQSSLFLYEPDLVTHIAELLQLDRGISVLVQTAAIAALDALARYRGKIQEVLSSVNAGVNHGVLMALVRKTVSEISSPESILPHSFVDALLSFVTFIASHAAGGNMVVGAGLVPLLIQIIDTKIPKRLSVVSKAMQLVDNVLYSFANAFQLFCSNRGVEVLVDRIAHEVDHDIEEYGHEQRSREMFGSYGHLPVARGAVLKHTLRSLHRMMQSSGTAEGLRGLIDMSILKSIKKIIEYRGLFGPSILPIAINIMATFVHNEPTSLGIIQEAGLPETFYKAIEAGIEPVIEVIQAIPHAIGALCLNQAGQDQLSARPSIIPGIFSIFTSERHLKVLQDKENAVLIGTSIDELIRHHPSLKVSVYEALKSTLSKIEELGNAYVVPENLEAWYKLRIVNDVSVDADITMEELSPSATVISNPVLPQGELSRNDSTDNLSEESDSRAHDNTIVAFIDILGRFFEGLFQHPPHCKDFIAHTDGLEHIGRLTALPCLPYDFATSVASDSLVQVMRTMTEVSTNDTLNYLTQLVRSSLDATRTFWGAFSPQSKLSSFIDVTPALATEANHHFRQLVTLHVRITLLSDVFSTAGYAHGRAAVGLLQILLGASDLLPDLGSLHRISTWENILLKNELLSRGIDISNSPQPSPLERSPVREASMTADTELTSTANGQQAESSSAGAPSRKNKNAKDGARDFNGKALKQITHNVLSTLAPFFQSVVKLFYARRNPDATQKKQILDTASLIANVMLKHVTQQFDTQDRSLVSAYHTVMLGLITVLLMDDRSSQNALHTVLLVMFDRIDGLTALFEICRGYVDTIQNLTSASADTHEMSQQELASAYAGLRVALHLLYPLVSSKPLFDSGETIVMMTKDKKETEPDYFEPHNFLVRVRLVTLPLLRELWEASWLLKAPLPVSRSIAQVFLELASGENEEIKTDAASDAIIVGPPSSGVNVFSRATGPDPSRIRQLTDMGFPRSAAERALMRAQNNVNAATELLLANPFPLPPDPETDFSERDEAVDTPDGQRSSAIGEVADGAGADLSGDGTAAPPVEVKHEVVGKTNEEWRMELDGAREPLLKGITRRALQLIDEHPGLIFDVYPAFTKPSNSHREKAIHDLIEDIKLFSPDAYDVQEQPLAVRCRLLALILNESPSALTRDVAEPLMSSLLALLLSNPIGMEIKHPTIPKWMAAHLLVAEALLTIADQPKAITLPKENEAVGKESNAVGPNYVEARTRVFDFCMRLLPVPDLPNDELLSVLRLFVLLTKDHNLALQFVKRDGVPHLFNRLRSSPVTGSQSYIAIILRHVVEDRATLQHIMRQEIRHVFSQSRSRACDITTYMRYCSSMALRAPEVFVEVSQSMCQIDQPFASVHVLTLKPNVAKDDRKETGKITENITDMQVDVPVTPAFEVNPSFDSLEMLVHFLVSGLIKTAKGIVASASDILPSISHEKAVDITVREDPNGEVKTSTDGERPPNGQKDDPDAYFYCCFLMQCLTELLFSYDSCKIAFLSYSPKKRSNPTSKETNVKHRHTALNFLLSDLISFETINPQPGSNTKNRIMLCNWAMSVVVALCVDTSSVQEHKEVSSELLSVRKFVLEAVSRAIKDISPSELVDTRYGRLLALSDLCHRLLTARFNNPSRKATDEIPTHIAKVMLEKNYVATLTGALSEVDLNYPNVRTLVASILKPLEHLTKIAIKMSRPSDKGKEVLNGRAESVVSAGSEEEEEDEAEDPSREETPDVYRTSSLGMFGGEMDDGNYDPEDEGDEDMDDEDEDVEMDFAEETGSEDTSNTEEEDEEGLENDDHESEDAWQDEEEEDEDLVENDEAQDTEGDEEDEQGDEEMIWEDIHDEAGVADEGAEEQDDDEDAGRTATIPIIHAEDEDEPEIISDDDENEGVLHVNDAIPAVVDDVFGFGDMFANAQGDDMIRDGQPVFIPRRHRLATEDFGQARNGGPAAPAEAITHPLLLDRTSVSGPSAIGQGRHSRRSRNVFMAGVNGEILQTIEDLIGDGAAQLFHHLMTQGRGGGGTDTIRLDVPAGTIVNLERGNIRRPQGMNVISAALRVERAPRAGESKAEPRDFDPVITMQRWSEEVKILHGKFVTERAQRLGNHVILALLPTAIERAKELKAKAEQELARRREEQARAEELEATKERETQEEQARPDAERQASVDVGNAPQSISETNTDTPEPPAASTEPLETTGADRASDVDMEIVDALPGLSHATVADSNDAAVPVTQEPGLAEQSQPPNPPERTTIMIHGNPVDITDTGIDPTFLEALPDDMRQEVVNQHVQEHRTGWVERPADSQISSEFLDALPPEIRAEIIQQERLEQARRRIEEAAASAANDSSAIAEDIDPASFIASLEPQLRQDVLLDSDDTFIQTLPSHMLAEAGVYRDGSTRPRRGLATNPAAQSIPPTPTGPRKLLTSRDAILLLDKGGVSTLVRLLFFPQVLKKNLLLKVLLNLCENSKTRTELFGLLLNILQDGSGDLAAVDKSFAQMSFRGPQNARQHTPKSSRQRAGSDYFASVGLTNVQTEAVPDLIAQRCLEALSYIVSSNESSSYFFLTEHEYPAGFRKPASKKGKGKEKQVPQSYYPIVLLLGLLDRQYLLKTPSIMEQVVSLLATVTRPLVSLKDTKKENANASGSHSVASASQTNDDANEPNPVPSRTGSENPPPATSAAPEAVTGQNTSVDTAAEEKILLANPPQIPHPVLRLIVNILTVGECSGRTFQQSLALIQHLSHVPDARDVIAQELKAKAQELGHTLYSDLEDLAKALQDSQSDLLAGSVALKFSPASSDQAKLLRVLKTIDCMYSPKPVAANTSKDSDAEKVQAIYESFRFTPLWQRLGVCLAIIEQKPDTEHIATVLLPLIEALMVVCKYVGSKSVSSAVPRALRGSVSPRSPATSQESMEDLFVSFTDAHRKVLNLMVRNNPSLMSGSFSLLVNNPRVLDFDNKRNYFNQQLHRRPHVREHHGTLQLNVRRARVFEDSFQYLQRKTGDQIKFGKLSVRFYDEEGVDAGGVTREWFQILARQMFDPNNALFQPCAADRLTYQPNKNSWVNPEHLSFFKFVGRVIGKAIYDGRLLDAYFARSLYRQLLGKPVDYRDIEWVDPEYYNSLCWILENDPTLLDLSFSVEADEFGISRIVELKEGGQSISVTQENKKEFVQLSANYRLYSSIKDQIESLLAGFYEIIPKDLVTIFNEQELELLISGTPDIDVDEWRAATEYNGYSSSDPVIVWWWRALKSFNRDERAKVLSFATGTSRVPLGGFTDLQGVQGVQRFSIHKAYGESDRLPQAHTCFNQIDLPQYSSYEMLRQQLLLAINEGGEGFGFA